MNGSILKDFSQISDADIVLLQSDEQPVPINAGYLDFRQTGIFTKEKDKVGVRRCSKLTFSGMIMGSKLKQLISLFKDTQRKLKVKLTTFPLSSIESSDNY